MSNELRSPGFLSDPADNRVRIAETWGNERNGLARPEFQDRACSYAIALDYIRSGTGPIPVELLSGAIAFSDRHLAGAQKHEPCGPASLGSVTAFLKPFDIWWTNDLHGMAGGNIARLDGSVEFLSARQAKSLLNGNAERTGVMLVSPSAHFLFPRK